MTFLFLHFLFVFSKFQVSELFVVPSVLVDRRQADPHRVQFTEVHRGDELRRDHQDAHQWTCTWEENFTNPGICSVQHDSFCSSQSCIWEDMKLSCHSYPGQNNCDLQYYSSRAPDLRKHVQSFNKFNWHCNTDYPNNGNSPRYCEWFF